MLIGPIRDCMSTLVALNTLRARLHAMDEETFPIGTVLPLFDHAAELADTARSGNYPARQVTSALYHVTSAATMAQEATRLSNKRRLHPSRTVLTGWALARDPLAPWAETSLRDALLGGA